MNRWFRWMGITSTAIAISLAPALASADHERHRRHSDRHENVERHRPAVRHHGRHLDYRRGHRAHVRHRVRAARYHYCKPCNARFQSRNSFYHHLHHQHRVSFFDIPFVVAYATFGWIFHG